MKTTNLKRIWIGSLVLAGLTAVCAAVLFSQSLTTEYVRGGGRVLAVIHKPLPHFTDVSGAALDQSNYLFAQGITNGCTSTTFCPSDPLTRSVAAVFVVRSIYSSINGPGSTNANNFTYTSTPYFTDVPATHQFFKWIQKIKDLGITNGCTTTTYCPDDNVLNFQIAVYAVRARQFLLTGSAVSSFTYTTTPYFSDVPSTDMHFSWIQKAADLGIMGTPPVSAGCTSGNFCPGASTNRGQALPYFTRGIMGDLSF